MRCVASLLSRVHVADTLAPDAVLSLPAAASHHLTRVLRVAAGDRIVVFNDGVEYAATITGVDRAAVTVKLAAGKAVDRESTLRCTLAQVVASGERMDITLQKSVELGVSAVQPLFSERSVGEFHRLRLRREASEANER